VQAALNQIRHLDASYSYQASTKISISVNPTFTTTNITLIRSVGYEDIKIILYLHASALKSGLRKARSICDVINNQLPTQFSDMSISQGTYDFFDRICGNNNTSRMDDESVNNITNRSIPMPSPAVGGMPCSRAVM